MPIQQTPDSSTLMFKNCHDWSQSGYSGSARFEVLKYLHCLVSSCFKAPHHHPGRPPQHLSDFPSIQH